MLKFEKKTTFGILSLLIILAILALIPSIFEFPGDGLEMVGEENSLPEGSSFELGIANDYDFLGLGPVFGTLLAAILCFVLIGGIYTLWIKVIQKKETKD